MLNIKPKRTSEERHRYFTLLGASAQFALVLGILLGRLDLPNLDFLIGMLYGFSMVGNLAYLVVVVRPKNGGKHV
jgi:hypothetical protein